MYSGPLSRGGVPCFIGKGTKFVAARLRGLSRHPCFVVKRAVRQLRLDGNRLSLSPREAGSRVHYTIRQAEQARV